MKLGSIAAALGLALLLPLTAWAAPYKIETLYEIPGKYLKLAVRDAPPGLTDASMKSTLEGFMKKHDNAKK